MMIIYYVLQRGGRSLNYTIPIYIYTNEYRAIRDVYAALVGMYIYMY